MRGRRPELKAVDGGLLNAPPMPETLPAEMAAEWSIIAADLTGRGLLTTAALGLVETYIGALWTVRQCRAAIAKDGPIVRSKDGVPRPHPAGGILAKNQEIVARLGYELGLSPAGRNQPSVRAQTKAADDAADPFAEFDI